MELKWPLVEHFTQITVRSVELTSVCVSSLAPTCRHGELLPLGKAPVPYTWKALIAPAPKARFWTVLILVSTCRAADITRMLELLAEVSV